MVPKICSKWEMVLKCRASWGGFSSSSWVCPVTLSVTYSTLSAWNPSLDPAQAMYCPPNPSACCLPSPEQQVSFAGTALTFLLRFFIFCPLTVSGSPSAFPATVLRYFRMQPLRTKLVTSSSRPDSHLVLCLWHRRDLESIPWINHFLTLPVSLFITTPSITWWKKPFTYWPKSLLPCPVSLKQMST